MNEPTFTFETLLQRLRLDEVTSPFLVWREKDLFGIHSHPVKIDLTCFFFCLSGEMDIEINLQPCRVDKRRMLCFTTPCAGRILWRSDDFCCVGILFSKNYWSHITLREHALRMKSIRNPFINITDTERDDLKLFHNLLCRHIDQTAHEKERAGLHYLVVSMLYRIKRVSDERQGAIVPMSHGETLLYDFLSLLHKEYKSYRRVTYYAEALSLTPRHLTTVIRQVSGKSASQWIEEYTILEAQILLLNTSMTIKEIAYELNFNDQSLFSKYFSRVAGVSPEQYRKSPLKTNASKGLSI